MSNRPAGILKRIIAAFIDIFCVFFIYFLGNNICVNSSSFASFFDINAKYEEINRVVCPSIVEKGLGYYNDTEITTCTVYSTNEYIDIKFDEYKEKNPSLNESEIEHLIYDDYVGLATVHDDEMESNDIYNKNIAYLQNVDRGIFYAFTLLGSLVFVFIIPLVNKNHKTLGKMLMKLRLVTTKDLEVSNKHIIIEYISFYIIEILIYSLFLGIDSLFVFLPIISLMVILFSPKKQNLHHMTSSTFIVDDKDCIVFKSLEEKEKYDMSLNG